MPPHGFHAGKKTTSSTARIFNGLRFGKAADKMKVVKASHIHEERKQLEEKKRRKSQQLFCRTYIVDLFTTDLSTHMCQKIAEVGMAANQEPGAIDWEIIPDAFSHEDPMDIDPQLDEWEDICEENMGPEGEAVARLQMIISCTFPPSLSVISITVIAL